MLDASHLRDVAVAAARAGGAAALRHFRSEALVVETKPDQSPVTIADRESEAAIRDLVHRARPQDGWVGEETGEQPGKTGLVWIVDPIDGTKAFVRGRASWTTLVACEDQRGGRRVIASAVFQPASGRMAEAWAGGGARVDGKPLRVSDRRNLGGARWAWYSREWFCDHGLAALYERLVLEGVLDAELCDADGHVRVAEGLSDVVVEPALAVWDLAATNLLVREAGGRMTDFGGSDDIRAGNAVITNGALHDEVLELLARLRA